MSGAFLSGDMAMVAKGQFFVNPFCGLPDDTMSLLVNWGTKTTERKQWLRGCWCHTHNCSPCQFDSNWKLPEGR